MKLNVKSNSINKKKENFYSHKSFLATQFIITSKEEEMRITIFYPLLDQMVRSLE